MAFTSKQENNGKVGNREKVPSKSPKLAILRMFIAKIQRSAGGDIEFVEFIAFVDKLNKVNKLQRAPVPALSLSKGLDSDIWEGKNADLRAPPGIVLAFGSGGTPHLRIEMWGTRPHRYLLWIMLTLQDEILLHPERRP